MLLDDGQISARLTPQAAVAAMRQAITDAERGVLAAPARVASDLGQGRLIFTTGARAGEWFGYRSYDTFGADPGRSRSFARSAWPAQKSTSWPSWPARKWTDRGHPGTPRRDYTHRPAGAASAVLAWRAVATRSAGASCALPYRPGRASPARAPARARPVAAATAGPNPALNAAAEV